MKKLLCAILMIALLACCCACGLVDTDALVQEIDDIIASELHADVAVFPPATENTQATVSEAVTIDEYGTYSSKEDVALYILTYNKLPENYITKNDARDLGWEGGSLEPYAPGKSIGGDRFGNYEGLLPEAPGRTYTECDIDTCGASSRGAKRIVFSNDGLIYYTEDHYESFTLIYGGDAS